MYRANRYCRHLNQSELNQRIRDIFLNMLRVTPDVKISLPPLNTETESDLEIWTHVLEEMKLRHGPYPNGFTREILHSEPLPDFVGELGKKAGSILASRGLGPAETLIKFGKAEHMQSLFETGALRVQPANNYATPKHNSAIRDDELSFEVSLALSRDNILKLVANPQDVPVGPIERRLDLSYATKTDYWLYCVSSSVESRLFVDFEADSCVIIKDKERFQRLLASQNEAAFGGAGFRQGEVIYIDPLFPSTVKVDIQMSKHFRYKYQREYRYIWIPATEMRGLSHINLELGSLEDIAELVIL